MKKIYFLIKILTISLCITSLGYAAKSEYYDKGIKLFNKKEFDKSKFLFEKDIVFNPKSEKSYLYLAKIFKNQDKDLEEEKNLSNVLLLNPQNDEAIYLLILLKIKQSDYKEAKKLMEKFDLVCSSFCTKKKEIEKKFEKLIPENEKN